MRTFVSCLLLVACAPAFAHVGATSAGVTTNVPDPTQPSADVQQQSASFVQSNARMAAAANRVGGPVAAVRTGDKAGTSEAQKTGAAPAHEAGAGAGATDKTNAAKAKAAPAPPPAPPPVYKSVIHRIGSSSPDGSDADSDAAAPAPDQATPAAEPAPAKVAAQPAREPEKAGHRPVRKAAPIKVPAYQPDRGGSGDPPGGYAFPVGLLIAGGLLAFGLTTYLRLGRNESRRDQNR